MARTAPTRPPLVSAPAAGDAFISKKTAAQLLGVSVRSVENYATRGLLKPYQMPTSNLVR